MATLYLISIIPLAIGGILFYKNPKIHWAEWLIGTVAALTLSGIVHIISFYGLTGDTQVISGQVESVEFHPEWVEKYRERHESTTTDSKGNTKTRVWYTTEYDTHHEKYVSNLNYGRGRYESDYIDQKRYNEFKLLLGGTIQKNGKQSARHGGSHYSGDNNIYLTSNTTRYIIPVIGHLSFINRIKASKSIYTHVNPPKDVKLFEYKLGSRYVPDRLYGKANQHFDELVFNRLNTELGPIKKINIIFVAFNTPEEMISKYQEAKWLGGKKNDFVICYYAPESSKPAKWSYVFGYTDSVLAKRNIETIMLTLPINNDIFIPIKDEIIKNYTIKNWDDFNYISIEPPTSAIIWLIILMTATQIGLYVWFHKNDFGQNKNRYGYEKKYRIF